MLDSMFGAMDPVFPQLSSESPLDFLDPLAPGGNVDLISPAWASSDIPFHMQTQQQIPSDQIQRIQPPQIQHQIQQMPPVPVQQMQPPDQISSTGDFIAVPSTSNEGVTYKDWAKPTAVYESPQIVAKQERLSPTLRLDEGPIMEGIMKNDKDGVAVSPFASNPATMSRSGLTGADVYRSVIKP